MDKRHSREGEVDDLDKRTTGDMEEKEINAEEIARCIATLELLNNHTDLIFDIPKTQRIALIKASGQLSRPSREEFSRRKKDAKKAERRKRADEEFADQRACLQGRAD